MKFSEGVVYKYFLTKQITPIFRNVLARFENITQSPVDHRSYRGLILKNGIKVLLVRDLSAKKAAVFMDIGIGKI